MQAHCMLSIQSLAFPNVENLIGYSYYFFHYTRYQTHIFGYQSYYRDIKFILMSVVSLILHGIPKVSCATF